MDSPIFSAWCVFITKVEVFKDKVVIGSFFGLNKLVIGKAKINSVSKNLINEVIISTVGGEDYKVTPWSNSKRKELFELLHTQ